MSSAGAGRWLRLSFLVAVLLFGVLFVGRRWPAVSSALHRLSLPPVVVSFAVATAGLVANMLAWRALLADFGSALPLRAASRVFFVGQLGKYIPGSVWSILAQAEMGRDYYVPRPVSVTVSILGTALSVFAGVALGIVLLPAGIPGQVLRYWWVALVLPLYVVVLQPPVATAVIDTAFRVAHREPPGRQPTYRGMGRALGWQVLSWLLLGLHAWLLVVAFGGPPLAALPTTIGAFTLAYSVGLVFVPAPAAVGVREAVLGVLVGGLVGSGEAIAVVLLSRVILAALDFALAGQALLSDRTGDSARGEAVRRRDRQ